MFFPVSTQSVLQPVNGDAAGNEYDSHDSGEECLDHLITLMQSEIIRDSANVQEHSQLFGTTASSLSHSCLPLHSMPCTESAVPSASHHPVPAVESMSLPEAVDDRLLQVYCYFLYFGVLQLLFFLYL